MACYFTKLNHIFTRKSKHFQNEKKNKQKVKCFDYEHEEQKMRIMHALRTKQMFCNEKFLK